MIEHPNFNRVPGAIEYTPESGTDALPDNGGVVLLEPADEGGFEEADRLGMSSGSSEGGPAEALNAVTDEFDASIQRDLFSTDTDKQRGRLLPARLQPRGT